MRRLLVLLGVAGALLAPAAAHAKTPLSTKAQGSGQRLGIARRLLPGPLIVERAEQLVGPRHVTR